jgi:translation initiation factor 2 subunit 1
MNYEEGDIIIGTVDKIVGTSVFIKLDSETEGVMTFSEVAPGRIRNIRDYVNPGQKVVVKILRIDQEKKHFDLSLRRVNQKEKKEVLENEKKEHELLTLIKIVTKNEEKSKIALEKLKAKTQVSLFFNDFLNKPEKEFISEIKALGLNDNDSKTLHSMLKDKVKEKKVTVKAELDLHCDSENGIEKIKKVLSIKKDKLEIKYLGAPSYMISVEDKDYKEANKKIKEVLDEIQKRAKSEGCFLEIKQDKK